MPKQTHTPTRAKPTYLPFVRLHYAQLPLDINCAYCDMEIIMKLK